MKIAICLLQMLLSGSIYQQELILGGFSYHLETRSYRYAGVTRHLNEINPTIGLAKNGWQIVVTKNSYYKVGGIQSYNWDWWHNSWVYGVKGGLVTGYKNTPIGYQVLPFAQLELGYKYKDVTSILGLLPNTEGAVITLHWKVAY